MRGPVSKRWMVILFSGFECPTFNGQSRRPPYTCCLRHRPGRRAPGISSRKQAAAEKRAFQRAVAVHAAAAETGGFAGGVEAGDDLAILAEHARVEVGLETAQRLAGQDVEFYCDQWAMRGIEDAVRSCGADQFIADIS